MREVTDMADCGCDKAKAQLEEFLHGELTATDHNDIAEHVGNCPPCEEEKTIGEILTKKVKQACCERAPEELTARILSELDRDTAS
jgi:anti-sigma factor (TIGR02949 family)